ncbi:MAG: hypothetical protein LQ343_000741 [Gyalolechia ehrenbergii]|nr:MAG: hypothetical protein LQ343_000741 [Gyalolechia ehrenbergii]
MALSQLLTSLIRRRLSMAENYRRRGKFEEVAFIFPNAPNIPITVNFGMQMPGWYDIIAFNDLAQQQDQPGILKSRDYFHSLIKAEIDKGIPSSRIILGIPSLSRGFSQGGSISIFAGLTSPHPLAGIFGLSSYLLLGDSLATYLTPQIKAANSSTPIFMGHGDSDQLVKVEWGQQTANRLKALGWRVDFNIYKGLQHNADPKEMDDLETWLRERLPAQG